MLAMLMTSLLVGLWLSLPSPTLSYSTPTVVLDRRNIVSTLTGVVSIIVKSEDHYTERNIHKSIEIYPRDAWSLMLIQFDYLDIEKRTPCKDKLTICQLPDVRSRATNRCFRPLMRNFCGGINDYIMYIGPEAYRMQQIVHQSTMFEGHGLYISWVTHHPKGRHLGFQLTISSYRSYLAYGYSRDHVVMFRCHDGKYIATELHCDNVTNCADWSDETTNCSLRDSRFNMLPGVVSPGLRPHHEKCVGMFGGHCALYKYWLSWTLPLIAILTLVLIALKGSRLRQRRHLISQLRMERLNELHEAAEHRLEVERRHHHEEPPATDLIDGVTPILILPPYSPREQPPPYKETDETCIALTSEVASPKDETYNVPLQTQV